MKNIHLKKSLLIIGGVVLGIAVVTFVLLLFSARTYTIYMRERDDPYVKVTPVYSQEGIVDMVSAEKKGKTWQVTFRALQPGEVVVTINFTHSNAEYGEMTDKYNTPLHVTPFGTILEKGFQDFNGFFILCGGIALAFLFAGLYLLIQYRRKKKQDFFSYDTVQFLGLGLFFLLHGLLFFGLEILCFVTPDRASGRAIFFAAQYAMTAMVGVLLPFILLLAFAMAISNVWLIRHEGLRKTNLLALLLAAVLIGGVATIAVLFLVNTRLFAFEPASVWVSAGRVVISALFLYFGANLVATQYCCVIAAHRKPPLTQDFVLILGCAIKKDGTLYPLLKGRADRAIEFYKAQKAATGVAPVLVPSGGQGSDEVIAEAEAVRRYLIAQGIDEADILTEAQSANTLENMKFSKALIDAKKPDANVIFSTTNYHVFRSGILARDAGLRADGIAGKTRWYFWPNAQIREYVGLLVRNWKLHLVLVVLLLAFSLLFANLGEIINALT